MLAFKLYFNCCPLLFSTTQGKSLIYIRANNEPAHLWNFLLMLNLLFESKDFINLNPFYEISK